MSVPQSLALRVGVTVIAVALQAQSGAAQAVDLRRGIQELAKQLGAQVSESRLLKVAVADFPDLQGRTSDLGRFVAERLTTELSLQPEKFQVIERRRLISVIEELKLSMTGLVEPQQVKQLGNMLGADALVTGALSDLGTVVDVDARLILVETFRVLPAASVSISKDEVVAELLQRGLAMPLAPQTPRAEVGEPSAPGGEGAPLAEWEDRGRYSLRVAVVSVTRAQRGLTMTILLTNLGDREKSQQFSLRNSGYAGQHYVVDDLGNSYELIAASAIPAGDNSGAVQLVPNVGRRVTLLFEPLAVGAKSVTLVFEVTWGPSVPIGPINLK